MNRSTLRSTTIHTAWTPTHKLMLSSGWGYSTFVAEVMHVPPPTWNGNAHDLKGVLYTKDDWREGRNASWYVNQGKLGPRTGMHGNLDLFLAPLATAGSR